MKILFNWQLPCSLFIRLTAGNSFLQTPILLLRGFLDLHEKELFILKKCVLSQIILLVVAFVITLWSGNKFLSVIPMLILNIVCCFSFNFFYFKNNLKTIKRLKKVIGETKKKSINIYGIQTDMFNNVIVDSISHINTDPDTVSYFNYNVNISLTNFRDYDFCFTPNAHFTDDEKSQLRKFFIYQSICIFRYLRHVKLSLVIHTLKVGILLLIFGTVLITNLFIFWVVFIGIMIGSNLFRFHIDKKQQAEEKSLLAMFDDWKDAAHNLSFEYQDGYFSLN